MTRKEVRDLLLAAADPSFKEFNDRITNCDEAPSIGVRVPRVREIAAQVVKSGWEAYLEEMEKTFPVMQNGLKAKAASDITQSDPEAPCIYQEEHMLWGIVLGKAKMSREQRVFHLDRWVPGILSWADCDCSTSTFKFMMKDQEFWYEYCTGWLKSGREFEVRFALVTLMQYFINEEYIGRVLPIFAHVTPESGDSEHAAHVTPGSGDSEHAAHVTPESGDFVVNALGENVQAPFPANAPYYIRMAQAWALSVCFVKYRDLTWDVLAARTMDPWVQNKAIQKCRESYRVSDEDKELLKTLKM